MVAVVLKKGDEEGRVVSVVLKKGERSGRGNLGGNELVKERLQKKGYERKVMRWGWREEEAEREGRVRRERGRMREEKEEGEKELCEDGKENPLSVDLITIRGGGSMEKKKSLGDLQISQRASSEHEL